MQLQEVIEKNNGKNKIITNRISEYKGICVVWVMYDHHDQLLEVEQTADVFKELDYDMSWLMNDYSNEVNL